jgi:4-amino-4-deoxy-L-arabinose transferase-like glycosyltransferase
MIVDSLFSSLTCWAMFLLGRETFDRRVGLLAAWMWAFSPTAIHASITYIWETCFGVFFFTIALYFTVRIGSSQNTRTWIRYGALLSMTTLTNGAVLTSFVCLFFWLYSRPAMRPRGHGRRIAISALTVLALLSPWIIRNSITFQGPMFTRSGMGSELYGGMMLESQVGRTHHHGLLISPPEQKLYRELGESAYMSQRRHDAVQLILAHPEDLIRLSLFRVFLYWFGNWYHLDYFGGAAAAPRLALFGLIGAIGLASFFFIVWKRHPYWTLYAIPIVIFPCLYYLTHVEARYRHPIEPFLTILTAYAAVTLLVKNDPSSNSGSLSGSTTS